MNDAYQKKEVVIYAPRGRLIAMAAGCLIMLAIMWSISPQPNSGILMTIKVWLATIIGVPFFSLALLYFLWRIAVPRPLLLADAQGLSIGGTLVGVGRLGWQEIAGLRIRVVRKQRMLGVDLHDPAKVLARMTPPVRWLARMNAAIAGSAFYVPQAMCDVQLEEVIAELEERRAAFNSIHTTLIAA